MNFGERKEPGAEPGKAYILQTLFYALHLFLMSVTRMLETNG